MLHLLVPELQRIHVDFKGHGLRLACFQHDALKATQLLHRTTDGSDRIVEVHLYHRRAIAFTAVGHGHAGFNAAVTRHGR